MSYELNINIHVHRGIHTTAALYFDHNYNIRLEPWTKKSFRFYGNIILTLFLLSVFYLFINAICNTYPRESTYVFTHANVKKKREREREERINVLYMVYKFNRNDMV